MPQKQSEKSVFLNVPYDPQFQNLCLAYIAGVACFGLAPRATLEVPHRIINLIGSCAFSVHDLSRVQLDLHAPRTPRFNMPFELGMAVASQRLGNDGHAWFVFESQPYRPNKSLSDLDGTDVYVHQGRISGVLQQLCHAFIREKQQPSFAQMFSVYRSLRKQLPTILKESGAKSPFDGARAFRDVCFAAASLAGHIKTR